MDGLIQFFSEYNYDGLVYGLIDNGVLGFSTLLGIDIDRYFRGSGIHGAIYGALLGNTLSDFLGAIVDFPLLKTFGPLIFSIIMATRQIFSIVLSCIIFQHTLNNYAILGSIIVFLSIGMRIYYK